MRHRAASEIEECRIWPGHEGRAFYTRNREIAVEHSPRAGGSYVITREAKYLLDDSREVNNKVRARLTSILVGQRERGIEWPTVDTALVQRAIRNSPMLPDQRSDRLLRFISTQTETISGIFIIDYMSHEACAWSESIEWHEVEYLLTYLKNMSWIEHVATTSERYDGMYVMGWRLTVAGHRRIAEQRVNTDSSQAFVAMWFDDSMDEAYDSGIALAIEDAKFAPLKINLKEHINKIDDEIIAEIRRSRFVVADFTQGQDGARGGVYYEAGFAHGLGLPVIFTCRADAVETLHFDTSHYNHIVWETPDDLREKLKNRILAVIGEGPEIDGRSR